MNDAIFCDVETALKAAYRAEVNAVSPKSSTAITLDHITKTSRNAQDDYSTRRIDTRGLRPLEYFGQCALIRETVENCNLLIPVEIYALWARYALNYKKNLGYEGIAKHIEKLTNNQGVCLTDIVRSIYQNDITYSERSLAQKYNCSRSSINLDRHKAMSADYSLHALSTMRLDAQLKSTGIVGRLSI